MDMQAAVRYAAAGSNATARPAQVAPDGGAPETLISTEEFRPRLTAEGRRHPVTQLRFDRRDNEARWNALPPLEGLNLTNSFCINRKESMRAFPILLNESLTNKNLASLLMLMGPQLCPGNFSALIDC